MMIEEYIYTWMFATVNFQGRLNAANFLTPHDERNENK
jgi:hypothetical protein